MGPSPICAFCRHLRSEGLRCDAFPEGIPAGILDGLIDHREPVEGDRGIRWEQDPAKPPLDTAEYARLFATGLRISPATPATRGAPRPRPAASLTTQMPNWSYYENHPLIYRQDADENVDLLQPDGTWKRLGREGQSTLWRKVHITGDAVEVPFETIAHLVDPE